ncbi:MAG: relaxase/mobilization nuclease domain-containing protein [Oscillospiraceae bacterium]|nr:relaxase/mobilization nuclease domain-containing protein [Oscillospiraceae bacterium]
MATTRIISMHLNKGKTLAQCLHDRTAYATNPEKTNGQELISSFECDPRTAESEFLLSKREYQILTGRRQKNDVIAYQIRQSFKPGEVTPEEANRIGYEFADRFLKGKHAFLVCTHTDRAHIHNHIIWNSTTLDHKHKFRDFLRSARAVQKLSDLICAEHQLSVIEKPTGKSVPYNRWLGQEPKQSHREQLRVAIDNALAKQPESFEELLSLLSAAGCEIKKRRNPSIRIDGTHRFARFDTLGRGYSAEELMAIIAGTKKAPQRRRKSSDRQINLLVDIQTRMQQGKGPGYEHWAKSFNLKQMAETLLYLQEHKLLYYPDLAKRTEESTKLFNTLSEQIKSAEKRMTELSVLRSHIINYAKTREVYIAYRKAGYSKKFLAEHESEILLHKAAKNYFNEAGIQKLPSVKSINAEYADLLAEKKRAYSEYRKAREEMKELLIAKANVDRVLGIGKDDAAEKEAPSETRS